MVTELSLDDVELTVRLLSISYRFTFQSLVLGDWYLEKMGCY